jgi:hypothetical protein
VKKLELGYIQQERTVVSINPPTRPDEIDGVNKGWRTYSSTAIAVSPLCTSVYNVSRTRSDGAVLGQREYVTHGSRPRYWEKHTEFVNLCLNLSNLPSLLPQNSQDILFHIPQRNISLHLFGIQVRVCLLNLLKNKAKT